MTLAKATKQSVPPNMPLGVQPSLRTGMIKTKDGANLRYATCCDTARTRGTVCLFQGRRAYIERDYEIIEDLRARGFSVATLDWRGQGLSDRLLKDRLKGHIKSYKQYDLDLEAFMRQVVLPDCPPPYYGLAHSMGANVLLRSLQKSTWFEAAVMAAPFLGFSETKLPATISHPVIKLLKAIGLGHLSLPGDFLSRKFESNVLTHDRERYEQQAEIIRGNPDLNVGGPTVSWLSASLDSHKQLASLKGSDALRVPVLFVAAGDERVVSNEKIHAFSRNVAGTPVVTVENAYHEILLERDDMREQFFAAFDSFMDQHAPTKK